MTTPSVSPFAPADRAAQWTKGLLLATLVLSAIGIVSGLLQLGLLSRAATGGISYEAEHETPRFMRMNLIRDTTRKPELGYLGKSGEPRRPTSVKLSGEMPDARSLIYLDRIFTKDEYQRISQGFEPQTMEDHWRIQLEGGWLSVHRRWTGFCIYRVRLEPVGESHRVAEVSVNRDPHQYPGCDDKYDAQLLEFVIDGFLLGRNVRPPLPPYFQQ